MKKYFALLLVMMTGLAWVNAQEKVRWYSIEEAIALNMEEPRIMVIDVYTDWCGWCKRMDETTFSNRKIVKTLNEKFYPVKLNAEGKEDIVIGGHTYKFVDNGRRGYHEIAAIVTKGRLVYPTISYLGTDGKVIEVAPGYKEVDALKIYLDYFSEGHYRQQSFEEYSASVAPKPASTPPL